ncbi:hypothetical protein C5167_030542 [Papaver somniferum]|uniref:major latex protein 146-like n=1 Tax=Papaver somniferum TaxID=3469 RepID=UPI000E6FE62B|nr:major latex protein 146-like [Papaver somniferum]RZC86466.1 hypothetical protein C5167_030542 [Papaver somniferum]
MAQNHRLHFQNELKNCSGDQLYNFYKNEITKLPQVIPHIFKSVQILAGDGNNAGTVRLAKLSIGSSREEIVKEKIETVVDESRTLRGSIIDGDILRMYPKFEYAVTITPLVTKGGEESCLFKLSVEYEKENEDVPNPTEYMEMSSFVSKAVASHLAKKA